MMPCRMMEKKAFAVDECMAGLGWAEDRNVGAIHSADTVGEAHVAESSNHLLQVDKEDKAVG